MLGKALATGCAVAFCITTTAATALARPLHNVPKAYWITPRAASTFLRAGLVVDTVNGLTQTVGGSCTGTGAAKARVRNGLLDSGLG